MWLQLSLSLAECFLQLHGMESEPVMKAAGITDAEADDEWDDDDDEQRTDNDGKLSNQRTDNDGKLSNQRTDNDGKLIWLG